MKKFRISFISLLIISTPLLAEGLPVDTLKVVDIEEILIIATPKENKKLREQPASVTLLSQHDMQANQVTSIKNLTALVPNIFIPEYGSRLTSAIYIRGIGSRINTPSVGLYVDNVPYIDKSAFDFNYSDVERIDVLRGPQGTLYGRNAMGGLIRVHTKSPFRYQGTDLRLSAGTYGNYNASVTHYHRVSDKFAFSTGGFYEYADGFFENAFKDNKKIDRSNSGGGRFRGIYLPSQNLKLDLNVSYEYSDEGGYAYGLYDKTTGNYAQPAYNDDNSYYRNLLNSGLNLEYQSARYILNSVTGFQYLKDRMFIDQDFSQDDIYTIAQHQNQKTLTEEITLKSRGNRRWDWVTGAFGFYQWLDTNAPVTFKEGGMAMIQQFMDQGMAGSPMSIKIQDETMPVHGSYNTPTMGTALYHQSTINDFIVEGLSATVGLRIDYEKLKLTHDTKASLTVQAYRMGQPMGGPIVQKYGENLTGSESEDYFQLLPKFAMKYDFNTQNNIYATVSRGYRSGGYNIQMFSDLIQGEMMAKPGEENQADINEVIMYKPEYSWNYEIGSHLTLWNGRLQADMAFFLMDTRDQQISQFAPSGLGRMMVNAGRSRSYGAEASVRAQVVDGFSVHANYGFTHATFTDYNDGKVDYEGHYVPFVPRNTLSLGGEYGIKFSERYLLDELRFNLNFTGAGKIYWTEANDVSQKFYATVNGKISAVMGIAQIDFWARNLLDKDYSTFYFETMGRGYMQKGRPVQAGVDLRLRF